MTILIIEDNLQLRTILVNYLKHQGYNVIEARSGEEGMTLFNSEKVDLILLDIMLPGIDGFEVCRKIRFISMVPVIMITAKSEDHDKILGLDVGADDYIVKPFSNKEMGARIRAIMRRLEVIEQKNPSKLIGLEIDPLSRQVSLNKKEIHLTKKEFDLLSHFVQYPNQVFTRDHLLDSIWGYDYLGDFRTVDSHIKRLREKLKQEKKTNWEIKTIWGQGYLFEVTL